MANKHIQQRTIQSQNKIDTAAWQLFCEKGYYNTTTKEISKQAGISVGNFYNYYKDKMAVYHKLTADYLSGSMTGISSLEQLIRETDNKPEAIRQYIYAQTKRAADTGRFFSDAKILVQDFEPLNHLYTEHNLTAIHLVENLLEEIPEIHEKASYKVMARLIYTLVNSLCEDACSPSNAAIFEEYRQQIVELVQGYLFSL